MSARALILTRALILSLGLSACAPAPEDLPSAPQLSADGSAASSDGSLQKAPDKSRPSAPKDLSAEDHAALRAAAVPDPGALEARAAGLLGARLDQGRWINRPWTDARLIAIGSRTGQAWTTTLPLSMTPQACGQDELDLPGNAAAGTDLGVWVRQSPEQAAQDHVRWAKSGLSGPARAALCLQATRVWTSELQRLAGAQASAMSSALKRGADQAAAQLKPPRN